MPAEIPANPVDFLNAFDNPEAAARYAEGPRRFVPGLDVLHRLTGILLAERAGPSARILVLGAGGGLELKALAEAQPGWTFLGVDPSSEMLSQAARLLGPLMSRVELLHGYMEDAPQGPFDAAACLLTLHFLQPQERERTLRSLIRRLRPGAPFVAAHTSLPEEPAQRSLWMSRYAAFAVTAGVEAEMADRARRSVEASLPIISPEADEHILRQSGFQDVALFYCAFAWRGWVGHA